jgi:TonB family protein
MLLLLVSSALAAPQKSDQSQKDNTKDSDEIYIAGGDVKPPKIIHYVEPDSSDSSQDAYVEGIVRLSAVVNLDGIPSDLHVTKGLNAEEDRLAVEALKQWRFQPGTKKGTPVRVRINVEISYHLL